MDHDNITVLRDLALLQVGPAPAPGGGGGAKGAQGSKQNSQPASRTWRAERAAAVVHFVVPRQQPATPTLPPRAAPPSRPPQIQMRDLPGFLSSRQALLEAKSGNKLNWVAFALAHHLCGHHEVAAQVLEAYEGGGRGRRPAAGRAVGDGGVGCGA